MIIELVCQCGTKVTGDERRLSDLTTCPNCGSQLHPKRATPPARIIDPYAPVTESFRIIWQLIRPMVPAALLVLPATTWVGFWWLIRRDAKGDIYLADSHLTLLIIGTSILAYGMCLWWTHENRLFRALCSLRATHLKIWRSLPCWNPSCDAEAEATFDFEFWGVFVTFAWTCVMQMFWFAAFLAVASVGTILAAAVILNAAPLIVASLLLMITVAIVAGLRGRLASVWLPSLPSQLLLAFPVLVVLVSAGCVLAVSASAFHDRLCAYEYVASMARAPFHYKDCEWAKRIAPGHRVRFHDREAAMYAGFRPCAVCEP